MARDRHFAALVVASVVGLFGCVVGGPEVDNQNASVTVAFRDPAGETLGRDAGASDGQASKEDREAPAPRPADGGGAPAGPCEDNDRDGYGMGAGCRNVDCDDDDASVTEQCYRCREPATGCECRDGDAPVPCDYLTDRTTGADGVCHLGQRNCQNGRWTACQQWRQPFRYQSAVSECAGSCAIGCRHQVICPEAGHAFATSTGVRVGAATAASFCPSGTGVGGVTTVCTPGPLGSYTRGTSPLNWVDVCASAGRTSYLPNTDDSTFNVNLPFTFNFYGVPYNNFGVSLNGIVGFPTANSAYINATLPYATTANSIFAFWDDLYTRGAGVCVNTFNSPAGTGRQVIVQWSNVFYYFNNVASTDVNFEVALSETTHTIDVLYGRMVGEGDRSTGSSATIGIQQGTGSSYDLVGFNTAGTVTSNSSIRWSPNNGMTTCQPGVYRFVTDGLCGAGETPNWGQFNYTALIPAGASIAFEARTASSAVGLVTAPAVRLPDAVNNSGNPVSIQVGDHLRAYSPRIGLDRLRFLEITAYLNPTPTRTEAPTLISHEVQFTCSPIEDLAPCRAGAECNTGVPCQRGLIQCVSSSINARPVERCVAAGSMTAGTVCGTGRVCSASGVCAPCVEGEACSTGAICQRGAISCSTGAPVCNVVGSQTAGTVCEGSATSYIRSTSNMPWTDVCSMTGRSNLLVNNDDGYTQITLPWTFQWFGAPTSRFNLAANGMISFGSDWQLGEWNNSALPAVNQPDTVFAFWDDLNTRSNGICTIVLGAPGTRQWIAQWSNAYFDNNNVTSTSINFEIVLSEETNSIDVLYGTMIGEGDRARGNSATIGIQRDSGSWYDQYSHNLNSLISSNRGIRWTPDVRGVCNGTGSCACAPGYLLCGSQCRPRETYYRDEDGDTWGGTTVHHGCPSASPAGYVSRSGDCNDTNPAVNPGAAELCNGQDENCNGQVDEGFPAQGVACNTGQFGRCAAGTTSCSSGTLVCVRTNAPTAELCNGQDEDCNGQVDNGYNVGAACNSAGTGGCQTPGVIACNGVTASACTAVPRTTGTCNAPAGGVCTSTGACACSPGQATCSGTCTNLQTDNENCGACGNECTPSQVCVTGACIGNGQFRVTLTWDRPGDMDLHVVPPCGTEIYYNRLQACGGELDRDDITGTGPENIFWLTGAVSGTYLICVVPYNISGPTNFTVNAVAGTSSRGSWTGSRSTSVGNRSCSTSSPYFVGAVNL